MTVICLGESFPAWTAGRNMDLPVIAAMTL